MPPTTLRAADGVPKMQQMVDTARRRLRVDQKAADAGLHDNPRTASTALDANESEICAYITGLARQRREACEVGLGRLQLWSAWQVSSRLQLYAFAELDSNNSSGEWQTESELKQLALRYSSDSSPYYVIEAGKILPPLAIFSERNLSSRNPLISRLDFLYADYPLGISVTGTVDRLDYRAALVDQPYLNPDYIPGQPGDAYRPDLGLGFTPLQGLRFGLAWSKGPYLNRQLNASLPAGSV